MITNILYTTILSLVIIILLHYFFNFFKDNLTVPKIKDLVNIPTEKYNTIYNKINNSPAPIKRENKNQDIDMKNELKSYMKNLSSQIDSTPIPSNNNQGNYTSI